MLALLVFTGLVHAREGDEETSAVEGITREASLGGSGEEFSSPKASLSVSVSEVEASSVRFSKFRVTRMLTSLGGEERTKVPEPLHPLINNYISESAFKSLADCFA